MIKKLAILGATGSIGKTTLNIVSAHPDKFKVSIIANFSDLEGLKKLIEKFKPEIAICVKENYFFKNGKVFSCTEDILADSNLYNDCDIVINGIAGIAGLKPTMAVLNSNATLATANKESFVCAGEIINKERELNSKVIYPLDSEHNTVWQLISGNENNVKTIILTASGGAFRDLPYENLKNVTAVDALKHPNWVMGKKVTIDCATLVNKGMEIIEARYLFNCDNIKVVQHNESIIHAMVELKDNSILAGLSYPDMTLPIQYALSYPNRLETSVKSIDFSRLKNLNFGEIDTKRFPCFKICQEIAGKGDGIGTIFNSANEVLVKAFLEDKIGFYDIPRLISMSLDKFSDSKACNIEEIFCIDRKVSEYTLSNINSRRAL
jgi:1-deoxy-D-xylulose-5-phosphate reductoisomerase